MINAIELRHNGYYHFEKYGEGKLCINDEYKFYVDFPNQSNEMLSKFSLEQIKPIPLTVEILEKCGFEAQSSVWFNKDEFTIMFMDRGDGNPFFHYTTFEQLVLSSSKKYVHELQNLWYAIYGEELNITL